MFKNMNVNENICPDRIASVPTNISVRFRYQTELPKKIKARGKEAHLLHDELVQTIKWKLAVRARSVSTPILYNQGSML
jgi:hypothetical protein